MKKSLLLTIPLMIGNLSIAQQTENPNIVLLMCDDLGWGDVGFNGNKIIKTQNLDALAREGMVMDRFYSGAPVSSPTRASVLTGRNPFRTGVFFANEGMLRPEEVTLPEMLKKRGYVSGHFGKWHLGTLTDKIKDSNRGGTKHPELLNPPAAHGYDAALVTEARIPTYDPMTAPLPYREPCWDYISDKNASKPFGTYYWDIDGNMVTDNLSGDDSRVLMDRVIPFIDKAVNEAKPFLSVVWFHAPHVPCVAGPEHASIYRDYPLNERNYYGCITAMDEQVGRLVNYLKNKGIFENTIIFFCSDNGPEETLPGSTGPFRERKRSLHEGGLRVPALAVWKGRIPAGVRVNTPCVTTDYFPTLMDILQIDYSHKVDGESIYPLLVGKAFARTKPVVFCSDNQGAVLDGAYKLYYRNGSYELYLIEKDPYETNNVAEKYPKQLAAMKAKMLEFFEDYKNSFDGGEYGKASYNRVHQEWKDVMKIK